GVGGQPRVGLADPAEVAESGGPVVAGPGVDAGQVYGHGATLARDTGTRAVAGHPVPERLAGHPHPSRSGPPTPERASPGHPYDVPVQVFRINGSARLVGQVRVPGAKNSVLKLMAAALLADGTTTLTEVPRILDVSVMGGLLRRLGCQVTVAGGRVEV